MHDTHDSTSGRGDARAAAHLLVRGDARRLPLADGSVHCAVTSPPYFGLRNYSCDGQIGLEETPDEFVESLIGVFREVRRVLRDDGCLFLNLGDSYAGSGSVDRRDDNTTGKGGAIPRSEKRTSPTPPGIRAKNLIGIPWRCALALQKDGWWLRSAPPWIKYNGMPESTEDRPGTAHEYVFLLTKSERYFYDCDAVRKPHAMKPQRRPNGRPKDETPRNGQPKQSWPTAERDEIGIDGHPDGRNRRTSDWFREGLDELVAFTADYLAHLRHVQANGGLLLDESGDPAAFLLATEPSSLPHYAMMPQRLVEPCILAGCPPGGTVLDPFSGMATTGVVALRLGRNYVGVELNAADAALSLRRLERPHDQIFARRSSGDRQPLPGQTSFLEALP